MPANQGAAFRAVCRECGQAVRMTAGDEGEMVSFRLAHWIRATGSLCPACYAERKAREDAAVAAIAMADVAV